MNQVLASYLLQSSNRRPPATAALSGAASTAESGMYVLDSGTFANLTKKRPDETTQGGEDVSVTTANGEATTEGVVYRKVDALGGEDQKFYAMPDSPDLLCLGELCAEQGHGFYWPPWHKKPNFHRPDGSQVQVKMDHYVPLIAGASLAAPSVQMPSLTSSIHDVIHCLCKICHINFCFLFANIFYWSIFTQMILPDMSLKLIKSLCYKIT